MYGVTSGFANKSRLRLSEGSTKRQAATDYRHLLIVDVVLLGLLAQAFEHLIIETVLGVLAFFLRHFVRLFLGVLAAFPIEFVAFLFALGAGFIELVEIFLLLFEVHLLRGFWQFVLLGRCEGALAVLDGVEQVVGG